MNLGHLWAYVFDQGDNPSSILEGQHILAGTVVATFENMKIAIPLWEGRISPVFDEAGRLLILDTAESVENARWEELLLTHNPFKRAQSISEMGVELLICGMISQMQLTLLDSAGIRIIPHICGSIEDVIAAFLDGCLENGALLMPGCGRRKQQHSYRNRTVPNKDKNPKLPG